jgi:hypothetical protein
MSLSLNLAVAAAPPMPAVALASTTDAPKWAAQRLTNWPRPARDLKRYSDGIEIFAGYRRVQPREFQQ